MSTHLPTQNGHLGIEMVASLTVEGIDTLSDIEGNEGEIEEAFMLGRNIEVYQAVQSGTDGGPERVTTSSGR